MTNTFDAPRLDTGTLLIADISGYTNFLGQVTAAHPEMIGQGGYVPPAYSVLSSLLDVVLGKMAPDFRLSDLEGDAVFGYAPDDGQLRNGTTLLEVVRLAYGAFRERVEQTMALQTCDCDACMILPSLDLKFVVHHGTFVVQQIAGRERLLSPAVNLIHRLMKNSITERTGHRAYLFVTETAAELFEISSELGVGHEESYSDVGQVKGIVIGLDSAGPAAA
jgi:hypothetical protein